MASLPESAGILADGAWELIEMQSICHEHQEAWFQQMVAQRYLYDHQRKIMVCYLALLQVTFGFPCAVEAIKRCCNMFPTTHLRV